MSTMDISFLFGSSSSYSQSSLYGSLGDYSSLRTGTYRKLLRSYYDTKNTSAAPKTSAGTIDSAEKKSLLTAKSSADALAEAANKLKNRALFEKKEITSKDATTGSSTTQKEYDYDAIYKAVKGFVDSYNTVIEDAGEVDTKDVLRNTLFMTKQTAAYKKSLSKVGITIGSDNKLSLDEAAIKKADINELKTLFTGFQSFASKTAQKASAISSASSIASGSRTYTKSGTYDLSNLYNRINTSI